MKQNLTRKPVISRVFFDFWHNTSITGQIFSVRERFLRSLFNNLVFKKSGLGLEKIGGLGLVT